MNGSFRPHYHHARLSAVGRCRSSSACVGHKYADHCTLYRQSQIFAREGINLDRSTLAGWGGQPSKLLEPLADAIGRYVRSGQAIFADDTPIKMQGSKKCATARIWTYVRDERPWNSQVPLAAWCKFSTNRQGKASIPLIIADSIRDRKMLDLLQRRARAFHPWHIDPERSL